MMTLVVVKTGLLSLLQDAGRRHYQHLGLTTGGAADEQAFFWANRLLGNTADSPVIEICYGGLQLKATAPCQIAITGADCGALINDRPAANWQTHHLNTDDILCFDYPRSGVRSYLAVKGGFQVPPVFGSVATVMREKIGGLDSFGSPLKTGDCLPFTTIEASQQRQVPQAFIADYAAPLTLHIIENRQLHLFREQAFAGLYAGHYQISSKSNQMATRLNGPSINAEQPGIISEGMALGAVQIPPDGQPIVLLKDRQTIGGYPVIGWVSPLDVFQLAQRQPGQKVKFNEISLTEAQQLLRKFYSFFSK